MPPTANRSPASRARPAVLTVINPSTGGPIDEVANLDADAVRKLAAIARAAQPMWAALGFERRAATLRRMQRWLADNRERVLTSIMSETGKTYEDAQNADWSYGLIALGFWAKHGKRYLADEHIRPVALLNRARRLVVRYEPRGLIGIIGPWNYPLANSFGDAIPALAAGNAVLLKPSEFTPLTSMLLAEGMRECGLPNGVLQVVTGAADTGAAVVDESDMVMFTGSTTTGQAVMGRAARSLTPVSLELGGKDPMIVLADADVERAANHAVYYSMLNAGQTCISIERVYVDRSIYDDFVERVGAKVRALRVGSGMRPGTQEVGSMTTSAQVEIVKRHVEDALVRGARAIQPEVALPDRGHWCVPTLLLDVDHSMLCMREETFGPTLPIMRVADTEEAILRANDSPYGLSASVFGRDRSRAEAVARRLRAGAVCVNDAVANYALLELPMGGWKASGIGTRHAADGIRKYCRVQSIMVTRVYGKRDPHMFPNDERRTRILQRVIVAAFARGRS